MKQLITGIHHITAIAGDAQRNVDFYAGFLGMKLIKKTVNFDAPEVYHFYYGDADGNPGSILTFFPYGDIIKGRRGNGMVNTIAFSVNASGKEYWLDRLAKFGIKTNWQDEVFEGEQRLYFEDHDGIGLELVFNDRDERKGIDNGIIPAEYALKGFYSAEIWTGDMTRTIQLFTEVMDHKLIFQSGLRYRYAAADAPGNYIDIKFTPDTLKGLGGNGTVHHIAFNTPDDESQEEIRIKVSRSYLNPTDIIDRNYFRSVYFREPGGVLFEIATSGPGFAIDEEREQLGEALMLPAQYEKFRSELNKVLPKLNTDYEKFR